MTSFNDCAATHRETLSPLRRVTFEFEVPRGVVALQRSVERFPFVPSDPAHRDERYAEVYRIQVQGLIKRLEATRIEKVVIGVSGGLDSAQATLVAVGAFDQDETAARRHSGLLVAGLRRESSHPRERARAHASAGLSQPSGVRAAR